MPPVIGGTGPANVTRSVIAAHRSSPSQNYFITAFSRDS
jgi:hypothetical protein